MLAQDHALIESLLKLLAAEKTDFPIFWRRLSHAVSRLQDQGPALAFEAVKDLFINRYAWEAWLPSYLQRLEDSRSIQVKYLEAKRDYLIHQLELIYLNPS